MSQKSFNDECEQGEVPFASNHCSALLLHRVLWLECVLKLFTDLHFKLHVLETSHLSSKPKGEISSFCLEIICISDWK